MSRLLWLLLAYACLGLAAAGVVLPGLPTTVFVLIALWAASHGHPELYARIEAHPRYGPLLRQWRQHRAVPRRAKLLAVAMMTLSALLAWRAGASPLQLGLLVGLFVTVGLWLLTRPEPVHPPSSGDA